MSDNVIKIYDKEKNDILRALNSDPVAEVLEDCAQHAVQNSKYATIEESRSKFNAIRDFMIQNIDLLLECKILLKKLTTEGECSDE